MSVEIDLQVATAADDLPSRMQVELWVARALQDRASAELTVRLVDSEESAALNARYRGRQGPTNVLSFPADLPPGIDLPYLGDVVVCVPLVFAEAADQGKTRMAHFAHLVVHGVLHLCGFDHEDDEAARRMEKLETRMLRDLGYADPWA